MRKEIDPLLLRTILSYDPETGDLTWKLSQGGVKKGRKAETITTRGYLRVNVNNCSYLVHRVAWAITHGRWPPNQIDHRDGDKKNNRLSNLREVTAWQNIQNRKSTSNTGVVGVHYRGYIATICVNGKRKSLGSFDTLEEAKDAYLAAAAKYHGHVDEDA